MLSELRAANELQAEFQNEVLKPVLTIDLDRRLVNAGEDNEAWVIASNVTNNGQVAAQDVRVLSFHDSNQKMISLDREFSLGKVVLAPGGGTISANSRISKAEAKAIMEHRELFFHTMAEYFNARHERYISYTTYRCVYSEGEFLQLVPVESNIKRMNRVSSQ